MTQGELGQLTGIAQSTISTAERMGNGSSDTPTYAEACGVNAVWLATGKGEMVAAASPHKLHATASAPAISIADAVLAIGDAIEGADSEVRGDVLKMFELFFRNPQANVGQLPLIVSRLSGESPSGRPGSDRNAA